MIPRVIPRVITVPPLVRERARRAGPAGSAWLTGLDGLLAELAREWGITVGEQLAGGNESVVARVRTAEGAGAVLKLVPPGVDLEASVRVLRVADGRGYVRLLAHDGPRRAVLMEELGPSLTDLGAAPEAAIAALCAVLRLAWQEPTSDLGPAGGKAASLRRDVDRSWAELGRPCSVRVRDQALRYADRRAAAVDRYPGEVRVVHGDPHPGNALRVPAPRPGAEPGFVFVDPDGFVDDPAYDAGVALRDWCPQLLVGAAPALARRWCRLLADGTGLDATAIWEWGFLERVSTGLYVTALGAPETGRPFLETAELLVG